MGKLSESGGHWLVGESTEKVPPLLCPSLPTTGPPHASILVADSSPDIFPSRFCHQVTINLIEKVPVWAVCSGDSVHSAPLLSPASDGDMLSMI